MADTDFLDFRYDPRTIRTPYTTNVPWPNPSAPISPQHQNMATNTTHIKRSTSPLLNQHATMQSMPHPYQPRPQSQGNDQAYYRMLAQQHGVAAQLQSQTQYPYEQQLDPEPTSTLQYPGQQQTYPQSSTQAQNIPDNIQSSPTDWSFLQNTATTQPFAVNSLYGGQLNDQAFMSYGPASANYLPEQNQYTGNMNTNMNTEMNNLGTSILQENNVPTTWQDLANTLSSGITRGMPDMSLTNQNLPNSPTDTSLEVRSLSSSDNGWTAVDLQNQQYVGSYSDSQTSQAIFNPEQTLHGRTFSDSSFSDADNQVTRLSWSYVEVPHHAISSPSSDGTGNFDKIDIPERPEACDEVHIKQERLPTPTLSSATIPPVRIKTSTSPQRSPIRRPSPSRRPRKNSVKCPAKPSSKRHVPLVKAENSEKRIGRRKGPLSSEQRKQASEIRKVGACLRCKFLKKTVRFPTPCVNLPNTWQCTIPVAGQSCQGCVASHARLWQVPCTRIDIKDIAFFMKDWQADVDMAVVLNFSVDNIRDFAKPERRLYLSHGYGHCMPIYAREIYVRNEKCFGVDWVETYHDMPLEHSVDTAKMSLGVDGISDEMLSDYLDAYIDDGYEDFIDQYFEGTPFVTEILTTVFRYYCREPTPVLKKALKFLLAYNLTQHVTYVEGLPPEEAFQGRIHDSTSKFNGKTVAPVMINFSVKIAMAKLWRELQKEILEELSTMYSSVYSKEKLRHWPTIFMVACILLAVWEEMQFDCHYRVPVSQSTLWLTCTY